MKSDLYLDTFAIEVIYMKNVVWLFYVKIDFGCVNYQNGFFHMCAFKIYFILILSTNFISILCFIIKFNTKSFLPKIDY